MRILTPKPNYIISHHFFIEWSVNLGIPWSLQSSIRKHIQELDSESHLPPFTTSPLPSQ